MLFNTLIKLVVVSVWFISMGWLIRFEAFPHVFDDNMQGYRELAKHMPAMRDSWMKVMSGDQHVGYVNSATEMTDFEGNEQLVLTTQLIIRIDFQGELQLLRLNNEVKLDAKQELLGSSSSLSMGSFTGKLTLSPIDDSDKFELSAQLNEMEFKRQIDIPKGGVISSPFMDSSLRAVRKGRTVKIRSMDPFSPSADFRVVEVTGLSSSFQTLPGDSREVEVTRVEMKIGDLILHAEVDEYGRIVRQETPFGITFEISDASGAMKIPKTNALNPASLLSSSAFPSLINLPENL